MEIHSVQWGGSRRLKGIGKASLGHDVMFEGDSRDGTPLRLRRGRTQQGIGGATQFNKCPLRDTARAHTITNVMIREWRPHGIDNILLDAIEGAR
jgi:hypothetical protein